MGYKCGNCNVDFASLRKLVEHNINVHESPFLEGGNEVQMSKDYLNKTEAQLVSDQVARNNKLKAKFDEVN